MFACRGLTAVTFLLQQLDKCRFKRAVPFLLDSSHRDISLTTGSMQRFEMSQCFTVILFYHYELQRRDNRCGGERSCSRKRLASHFIPGERKQTQKIPSNFFFKPATRPRVRGLWCVCVLFLCQENVTLLCQTLLFKRTVQRKLNLKSAGFFIFIFKAP